MNQANEIEQYSEENGKPIADSLIERKQPKKKKRKGCCGMIFILFLILFALFAAILAYFAYSYHQWGKEFEANMLQADAVSVDPGSFNYDEERNSTEEKIDDFVSSREEVNFIELDVEESAVLFADTISKSLPEFIQLHRLYLVAGDGNWQIYLQLRTASINLPITHFVIVKDEVEGVELFIDNIYIGNTDLDSIGLASIRHNINRAYYDGVLTINDNEFASHSIENIELEEGGITIKGRKN